MKKGDLVDTINGPGRVTGITWRTSWQFGRSRKAAVIGVQHGGTRRAYYSDQVWPYHRGMTETPDTTETPEPDTDDGEDGDEDE